MEFGRVTPKELENISFRLRTDGARVTRVLTDARERKPAFHLGCAKWGRKEWIGKIYPEGAKEKDFLRHYADHYDAIELNATNYLLYDRERISEWMDKVSDNPHFVFCPKAHRAISFVKNSDKKQKFTEDFITSIRHLGKRLGPVFMTINGKFRPEQAGAFYEYLESLPKDIQWFIEQRDPEFFSDKPFVKDYYDTLSDMNIGAVITDTAGRRDVLHAEITVPKAFIRFVGNSLHESDYRRIDAWARKLGKWAEAGIHEVYFFMHMHDEALSPELTDYTVKQFNKIPGVQLPDIKFL